MARKIRLTLLLTFVALSAALAQKNGKILKRANALNNEGYQLLQDGFDQMALETFKMAIDLDSTESLYYINLKEACEKLEDQETLVTYLEKAKRNLKDDDEIFYYSGNFYQDKGNYNQAIEDYTQSIDIVQLQTSVQAGLIYAYYFNRANSYFKSDQFNEAIDDFTATIQFNPKHHGAYTNRGIAKYKIEDVDGACEDWNAALGLGFYDVGQYLQRHCSK